jgi:hypothetical protein
MNARLAPFTALLGLGDVIAVLILSASMRDSTPKLVDASFAAARFVLVLFSVTCLTTYTKLQWIVAGLVVALVAPSLWVLEYESDAHARIDFIVSTCFAASEAMLILLAYNLSIVPEKPVDESDALNQSLLEEGRKPDAEASRVAMDPDSYKGQGASVRRMIGLAYPERWLLLVATIALFVSSIAGAVTPAVSSTATPMRYTNASQSCSVA